MLKGDGVAIFKATKRKCLGRNAKMAGKVVLHIPSGYPLFPDEIKIVFTRWDLL